MTQHVAHRRSDEIAQANRELVNITIERCAQRLDAVARATDMDVAKTAFEEAAAIIRALKDK